MLKIRLTRTGKKGQPSYRVVVAEHTSPIKSKFVDTVGFYNVFRNPRQLELDQDKIKYWISVGAQPTDSVACILKGLGFTGMDKFIGPRDLKRKKKKASPEDDKPSGSAQVTEAPVVEKAPSPIEEPAIEVAAPIEEVSTPVVEPVAEDVPTENTESTPASEEKIAEAS